VGARTGRLKLARTPRSIEQLAGRHRLLPGELAPPAAGPHRTPRAAEIVNAARRLLEQDGRDAVTMRRVADELGIQAPSLYKHFSNKAALELALIEDGLTEMGQVSHTTIQRAGPEGGLDALLDAYRQYSLSHPHLYRLATSGSLARDGLYPGLEEWAGNPWYVVTGDAYLAQALWSFAHGMVILELDDRYLPGSDLDRTLREGARAFEPPAALGRARLRQTAELAHGSVAAQLRRLLPGTSLEEVHDPA
jgi:AcrR family transcriptional regulator